MDVREAPESTRTWLSSGRPGSRAATRVLCFAHAGGSPASFRGWADELPDSVELLLVRLAGRDARVREPPATTVREIVVPLASAVEPILAHGPIGLLGHSLGALLAWELARELARRALPRPQFLMVSGRAAPRLAVPTATAHPLLHTLADAPLVAAVQRVYGGIPQALLDEPELLARMLPILRADLTVHETHVPEPGPILDCPLIALAGDEDPHVDRARLRAWSAHTSSSFVDDQCHGGHFYPMTTSGRRWLLARLTAAVANTSSRA